MRRSRKSKWMILLLVVAYGAWAIFRPLPPLQASVKLPPSQAAPVNLTWPTKGQAVLAAEGYGILAQHGQNKAVPVASTAKILTALVILKKKPLLPGQAGPTIKFGQADVAAYLRYKNAGGSVVPVQAGEQIGQYQALQAMLLPSANNMAYSLAVWSFGSLNNFLTYANAYAKALGLSSTHLNDASGFSPGTTSSARDLTLLGLKALDNPVLSQIVSQKTAQLPGIGQVRNVNWLLGVSGINGIKTGNTDQAGGCFIFSAKHNIDKRTITLVGAIVSDNSLLAALNDGAKLLDSADRNFSPTKLVQAGQTVGHLASVWGAESPILSQKDLSALEWRGISYQPISKLDKLDAPVQANQTVGSASITSFDKSDTVQLYAGSAIARPSLVWRLFHPVAGLSLRL